MLRRVQELLALLADLWPSVVLLSTPDVNSWPSLSGTVVFRRRNWKGKEEWQTVLNPEKRHAAMSVGSETSGFQGEMCEVGPKHCRYLSSSLKPQPIKQYLVEIVSTEAQFWRALFLLLDVSKALRLKGKT
jgi:hypothetical protein